MQTNLFCSRSNLHNEASVETWFVDPLLEHLGFGADDINLKESLKDIQDRERQQVRLVQTRLCGISE